MAILVLAIVLIVRAAFFRSPASGPGGAGPAATIQSSPAPSLEPSVNPSAPDEEGQAPPADDSDEQKGDALANISDEPADPDADSLPWAESDVPAGGRKAVVRSMGDVIIHEPLFRTAKANASADFDFAPFFEPIAPSVARADYSVINVDSPMGGKGSRGYRFYPQFNTPPHLLYALKDMGVDMLTLANNHALDTYYDGLIDTIDNVEKVGLAHVGAYRSQAEYDASKLVEINGIKVGVLNYTTGTNNLERSSAKEASVYGLRYVKNSNINKDVEVLRNAGAEIVLAYMHWDEEYERAPSKTTKKYAGAMAKAGVDVIIGGHSHTVQPVEWLDSTDKSGAKRRTLVAYSMGNFLSNQTQRYCDSGIIFEFTLAEDPSTGKVGVYAPSYVPTYVWRTEAPSGYDYRVLPVGKSILERPEGMSDAVYLRLKQVWNEQKALLGTDVARMAKE